MENIESRGNHQSENTEDWLQEWGSLSELPKFEDRGAVDNETAESELTYESGLELLGQLAEQFATKPSEDYSDADRQMISEIMRQAQNYARDDERKDADAVSRALRLRVADANNALMLTDKYHFSSAQVESAFVTHRNAKRALDEYTRACMDINNDETLAPMENEVHAEIAEESKQDALTLPGDVIS